MRAAVDSSVAVTETKDKKMMKRRKLLSQHWSKFRSNNDNSNSSSMESRTEEKPNHYYPCNHNGPCEAGVCSCVDRFYYCERFCLCSCGGGVGECRNRFPGCRCLRGCKTKACTCFVALRECEVDVCGIHCGDTCKNANMQKNLGKLLQIAKSDVAGWGCFLMEAAAKHDFVAEYCGELVPEDEAEKRGEKYDQDGCSYLFELNADFSVDATRMGNKIRFANHSKNRANCRAKILKVNGDHRIGVFAKRDIAVGEELLLDYAYKTDEQLELVNDKKAIPAFKSVS